MGHEDPNRVGPFIADDRVHVGASDAGAHIQSFATYGDTGYLFSEFVRKGKHLSLEHAVRKITRDTAQIWGMADRGELRAGMAADVVVFAELFEHLDIGEVVVRDMHVERFGAHHLIGNRLANLGHSFTTNWPPIVGVAR